MEENHGIENVVLQGGRNTSIVGEGGDGHDQSNVKRY
jgi:hypothetical protein